MPKKTENKKEEFIEKLEYLGLDLENIPLEWEKNQPLEFRISKSYEENQYRQYRYIAIKDIQILLSPTHRLDNLEERYKKASKLSNYLDSQKEENILRYATFLKMLEEVKIEEIEEIAKEQEKLNKKIPFKVKYQNNYLWQIYYSENTDQYFMIVPTEDTDYSTFFYLLKKQLEKKRQAKIFVPISRVEYSREFFKKSEFEDIANYLWLFTKDWPSIYEIYDKQGKLSIHIVGETNVYGKIKSPYKIILKEKEEATQFYRLLKALFMIQTEAPHHFQFDTNIGKQAELEFYDEEEKLSYEKLAEWIKKQYLLGENQKEKIEKRAQETRKQLEELKITVASQEIEYLAKEKQISTFLECKKSFFGKFKYYFKYSKKTEKNKLEKKRKEDLEEIETKEITPEPKIPNQVQKQNYTIEELIENYHELEEIENELKDRIMDKNALKLKQKNMNKKIENASQFIQEIDSHKKSIFEFWKYSNKDEVASLPEGEQEEVNIIRKIKKVFDYEEDFEKLGSNLDLMQRKNLTKEETDSIYLTTTNLINLLNKVKNNEVTPQDIECNLKELKKEANEERKMSEEEEFDIFGGKIEDSTKIKIMNQKKHRELPKDKFSILDIQKNTKTIGYKLSLEQIVQNIKKALEKQVIPEDLLIYKASIGDPLKEKDWNVFNIHPEKEIKEALKQKENKIYFYQIELKQGSNGIGFSNCIFYDNQNKTLPIGMDLSTQVLIDLSKWNLELKQKREFKIATMEEEKDDFSKVILKSVIAYEYDLKDEKEQ